MTKEITMPQMGFDMTEGTVANWLKAEGDAVKKGEAIAEIETDKTTIQIESFDNGVLLKIVAPAGAKVPVGQPIGYVGAPGEAVPGVAAPPAAVADEPAVVEAEAAGSKATPIALRAAQDLGVDLAKVKGSGPDGRITKSDVEAFATAYATAPAAVVPAAPASSAAAPAPLHTGRIVASPYAKKLAQERGVDLRFVKGSGPEGRIVSEDVAKAASVQPSAISTQPSAVSGQQPSVVSSQQPAAVPQRTAVGLRKSLSRMRATIAQRMTQSKTSVPHFYITLPVEMDAALALRQQVNDALKAENVKVSVNDMIVRAAALALKRFPNLNASFAGDAVETHEHIHIGVAVAIEGGLVTVTVRDADAKSLKEIAVEVAAMAGRARDNKLQPTDLGGQTFTLSNLGMYGITVFSAIINPPDAAILAIGAAVPTPVARDGQVVVKSMMNITLSGDHRVTDGAEGAQFIIEIKRMLENPWALVL